MKQIIKIVVVPFIASFVFLLILAVCLIVTTSLHARFTFTPEITFGLIDFQDVTIQIVEIENVQYSIKSSANPGSAGGYFYTIADEDKVELKVIHGCGGLYWADDNLSSFVTVQPDYDKGTTTCSAILSGNYIEVAEGID